MQGFLHCVWSPRMPYSVAEKGGEKKKKKSATPLGIPSGRDAPMRKSTALNDYQITYAGIINITMIILRFRYLTKKLLKQSARKKYLPLSLT